MTCSTKVFSGVLALVALVLLSFVVRPPPPIVAVDGGGVGVASPPSDEGRGRRLVSPTFDSMTYQPSLSPQPSVGDTVRLGISLDLTGSVAPTDADSATLKQTVATQLSLDLTNIRGWVLTYHFGRRRRHRRSLLMLTWYNVTEEGAPWRGIY